MASELDALFEENIGQLAVDLDKAIKSALPEYARLREAGQKGELTGIYISLLRSSVFCKLPWLRIDLCDKKGLGDKTECAADFDIPTISERVYSEAEKRKDQKGWTKEYQLEEAWLVASGKCFQRFEKHLPEIISMCETVKAVDCRWHFGEFLGNDVIVHERGNGES